MNSRKRLFALGAGVMMLGLAGAANAAESTDRVAELEARIAQLEGKQQEAWLNERRAEEIKTLVRDVLADADTRASLQEGGLSAGHDGNHFFLASDDGNNLVNVSGQLQIRHNYNHRQTDDAHESGFVIRRAKLQFDGHVGSPRIGYVLRLAADRDAGTVFAEQASVSYEFMDGWTVAAGRMKAPFLREENVSSKYQLAVERSLVNETFTTGYTEGLVVAWTGHDMVRASLSFNDGAGAGEFGAAKDFHNDATDFAFTGRVDVKVQGDWDQASDFSAWSGQDMAIFVGGGIHYELAETGDSQTSNPAFDTLFAWTIDGSLEVAGANVFAAIMGSHASAPAGGMDVDALGIVIQGGYMVIPDKLEPFVRFEWMDLDVADNATLLTFGANYYLNGHNAKFSMDVVWVVEGIPGVGSTGLGLQSVPGGGSAHDDQVAVRTQFQLLF